VRQRARQTGKTTKRVSFLRVDMTARMECPGNGIRATAPNIYAESVIYHLRTLTVQLQQELCIITLSQTCEAAPISHNSFSAVRGQFTLVSIARNERAAR